jgi:hypothetical protein
MLPHFMHPPENQLSVSLITISLVYIISADAD